MRDREMTSRSRFPAAPPDRICRDLLLEADRVGRAGEIPVTAGVFRLEETQDGQEWKMLSMESNRTAGMRSPLAHAEFRAIEAARGRMKTEYLNDAAIVTTLEPCLFCTGALLLSRIGAIYFFSRSDKGIRLNDIIDLSQSNKRAGLREGVSNHHPEIIPVTAFEPESRLLLENFFRQRRADQKRSGALEAD